MASDMISATVPQSSVRNSLSSIDFPIHTNRPLQNSQFLGREDDLRTIHSILRIKPISPAPSGRASCVLHGIGGLGKTQVALQYSYAYTEAYDAIFWLRAETAIELLRSYAMIAEKLMRSESSCDSSRDRETSSEVTEVRDWLENTEKRWLLVFDNAERIEDIRGYIPSRASCGAILVTTQIPDLIQITEVSSIRPLADLGCMEGTRLLYQTLGREPKDREEENAADKISVFVGHLPLSLTTIAGYIKRTMITIPECMVMLKTSNALWEETSGPSYADEGFYSKSLGTVFDIALNDLSENASTLLNILAFLNPDMIPEVMLLQENPDPLLRFLSRNEVFDKVVGELRTRQLVKRETPSDIQPYFSLHRSLQLSVLHRLSAHLQERQKVFTQAFHLVRAQMPEASRIQSYQRDVWHRYEAYVPQISSMRTHSLWLYPKLKLPAEFAQALIGIGTYLWHQGLLSQGREAMETAEQILMEAPVDEMDVRFSDIDDVLGIIDDLTGISCRADSLRRRHRAVKIRRHHHNLIPEKDRSRTDHIRLYNAEANLGCAFLQAEMFKEAEKIFEDCLVNYKQWTPNEHEIPFEYAKYYNHTAFVRTFQGLHVEAIKFARRACDLQEMDGGPHSPLLQYNRFNLGNQLFHAGKIDESLEVNQACLRDKIRICGKDNPWTLESYSATGGLLFLLGRNEEAKEVLSRCFENRGDISWTKEGFAMAHYRLSRVLYALGQDEEASSHAKIAEAIRDKFINKYKDNFFWGVGNEQEIHDQMIPIWAGRFTGRLKRTVSAELE